MNNMNELKGQYEEKYKGFGSYAACMSRALLSGLATFAFTFSGAYFTQVLFKARLPYQPKYFLILPTILSTAVAWRATAQGTQICQNNWMLSGPHYTKYDKK